jgi:hypothetical protein
MSVRIKVYNGNAGITGDDNATEWKDTSYDQRIAIDNEGYEYPFAPNEVKNFLDDGRGISVALSDTTVNVVQDPIPFGQSLS